MVAFVCLGRAGDIFCRQRAARGGSHLLPPRGMVVCSGPSSGRRIRQLKYRHTALGMHVWGFFLFCFLRFFCSHIKDLRAISAPAWRSQQRQMLDQFPCQVKHYLGNGGPVNKFPWKQRSLLHPGDQLLLGCPGQGHPNTHLPVHPLPSPSPREVDPTTCLPGTGILTRQHLPLVFRRIK